MGFKDFLLERSAAELEQQASVDASVYNFDKAAQSVWNQKDVEAKRNMLLDMISNFKYKAKAESFKLAARIADSNKLDMIAANLMQLSHGNRAIK